MSRHKKEALHSLTKEERTQLAHLFTLWSDLPPLRGLLILDNLAGHRTPSFVCWLMEQGIMPLYTPLSGS